MIYDSELEEWERLEKEAKPFVSWETLEDIKFLSTMRNAFPRLLEEVEDLRAQVAELESYKKRNPW